MLTPCSSGRGSYNSDRPHRGGGGSSFWRNIGRGRGNSDRGRGHDRSRDNKRGGYRRGSDRGLLQPIILFVYLYLSL